MSSQNTREGYCNRLLYQLLLCEGNMTYTRHTGVEPYYVTTALLYRSMSGGYDMEMHHNTRGSHGFIHAHEQPLITMFAHWTDLSRELTSQLEPECCTLSLHNNMNHPPPSSRVNSANMVVLPLVKSLYTWMLHYECITLSLLNKVITSCDRVWTIVYLHHG
jgi:hypothetical protein